MNSLKAMSLIGLLGLSTNTVQAMDRETEEQKNTCYPCERFEIINEEEQICENHRESFHPYEATGKHLRTDKEIITLYRVPLRLAVIFKGDALRGEKVRITCSDERSVLLSNNKDDLYKKGCAVMPEKNIESFDIQKRVNYNKLPDCYNAFKCKNINPDEPSRLVKTYGFGEARNLNGVSITIEETEDQTVWKYADSQWSANFVFFPWAPGVLSDTALTKDVQNPSSLRIEVRGDVFGLPRAKYDHNYLYLQPETDGEWHSDERTGTFIIEEKSIEGGLARHNELEEGGSLGKLKKKREQKTANLRNNK